MGSALSLARLGVPFSGTIANLPALNFNYKADSQGISSGGTIFTFLDSSGNSKNLTSSGSPSITTTSSGKLAVNFDGVDDSFISSTDVLPVNGYTTMILSVACTTNLSGSYSYSDAPLLVWPETGGWGIVYVRPQINKFCWRFGTGEGGNDQSYTYSSSLSASDIHIYTLVKSGGSEYFYLDGALTATVTGRLSTVANTGGTLKLGIGADGPNRFSGKVCELIGKFGSDSASDIVAINNYLMATYL